MATQYTAGLSAGQVLTAATMNSIGAAGEDTNAYLILDDTTFGRLDYNKLGY